MDGYWEKEGMVGSKEKVEAKQHYKKYATLSH